MRVERSKGRASGMTRMQAHILLLLAPMFWGGGNVGQKSIIADRGPFTAAGLRCLIGAAIIAPLLWRERKVAGQSLTQVWHQILIAAGLFTAAIGTQQIAFGGTSVTNGSFLITTTTIMTPAIAWLLLRERP